MFTTHGCFILKADQQWSAFFLRGTQNPQRDTQFSFFAGRDISNGLPFLFVGRGILNGTLNSHFSRAVTKNAGQHIQHIKVHNTMGRILHLFICHLALPPLSLAQMQSPDPYHNTSTRPDDLQISFSFPAVPRRSISDKAPRSSHR